MLDILLEQISPRTLPAHRLFELLIAEETLKLLEKFGFINAEQAVLVLRSPEMVEFSFKTVNEVYPK